MTTRVVYFQEIRDEFEAYIGDIVYATMVTVDGKGRPRSRVLIPVWEIVDGNPVGWLATFPTPVKEAHLAANPHATFAYWTRKQNQVHADVMAEGVSFDDLVTRQHVWNLYEQTSPKGAGYPLRNFWQGIDDPELRILRLSPWRIQVIRGRDLRSKLWRAAAEE
ncbi:pyridoxamine 5'-phosphate oxidase family protein [Nocardia sp. NPDC024068]|uniref:pyridoxamine 5'-phosphate oxidase family protein n=1 Tax=Nocardia sp. NPDC024068 TaxID=3157197 RepID=UPI0033D25DFF